MRKFYMIMTFLLGMALMGCQDKNSTDTVFDINQEVLELTADGGDVEIALSAFETWNTEVQSEWCMVTPTNGIRGTKCVLKVDSTYQYVDRETVVKFTSGPTTKTLTVKQKGYPKKVEVQTSDTELEDYTPYGKTYLDLDVLANVQFRVRLLDDSTGAEPKWVKVKDFKQTKVEAIARKTVVRLEYNNNTRPNMKSVSVIVEPINEQDNDAELKNMKLMQKAAPLIVPSRAGDSISLLAIERGLGAGGMWDPSQPMIYWENVKLNKQGRVVQARFFMLDTYESIPYEVKFLTEVTDLEFYGNGNAHMKKIALGTEILELPQLRRLAFVSYGLSSLPEITEGVDFPNLYELDLSGNTFTEIPIEWLKKIPSLRKFYMMNNRTRDGVNDLSTISETDRKALGLTGPIPKELFTFNNKLISLSITYNYFEGSIPDLRDVPAPILPNLLDLGLNINRLSGELPDWILNHPYRCWWQPDIFVYTQEGKDSRGNLAKFTNIPTNDVYCNEFDYTQDRPEPILKSNIRF